MLLLCLEKYTYNALGQLTGTKAVNADKQTVEESYQYDAFGRLISSTSNDGSVQNYTYDSNSNLTSYELLKDEEVKNSVSYEYNNLNRLTSLTSNGIITSYSYDNVGNLTQKMQNNGITVNYTYNKAGLVTRTESKKGSNVYTYSDCTYLLNGLMSEAVMPSDRGNGTKIKTYSYNDSGYLQKEEVKDGSEVISSHFYYYDTRGNRIYDMSSDGTVSYTYDANNRLSLTRNEKAEVVARYYYDKNGNMTAKQETNANISRGNASISGRASDTGLSIYRYDAFNRLIKYNSGSAEASYTYNADNLRTSKTVNREKTDFVWNGQNLAMESNPNTVSAYTYDMTGIHIANSNGTVNSYLKDYHGNVVGKANKSGSMIQDAYERMDYDAFGNQLNGNVPDPFGYCGEYYDNESGLIYLRNRYYDSKDGRFITEDPAKDGVNWYSYCGGNPVNRVDSDGKTWTYYDGFLPYWAQERIEKLTDDYYTVGDALNEYGEYVRDDIHKEAFNLRMQFLDSKWIKFAITDIADAGITEQNYERYSYEDNMTYYQMVYEYAMTLQDMKNHGGEMPRDRNGHISGWFLKLIGGGIAPRANFKNSIDDYNNNPNNWEKTGESIQKSTNVRNKGGVSIEQEFTNKSTGDKIYKHILQKSDGNAFESPHFRPYPKQIK